MRILSRTIKTAILSLCLSVFISVRAFAQAYDCGTYGAGDFGEGGACDVASGGDVADTGLNIWLIRAIAVILIVLAVFLVRRFAKRRKKH